MALLFLLIKKTKHKLRKRIFHVCKFIKCSNYQFLYMKALHKKIEENDYLHSPKSI